MTKSLAEIVLPAVGRSDLAKKMESFYAEVDASIARHRPVCTNRGACCKFGKYGHRLFVTSIELAYFARGLGPDIRSPRSADACPYQVDGRCTARQHRPLGCRVFFCDPGSQEWQPAASERGLARLKKLGDELGIDYRYVEWLHGLSVLASDGAGPRTPGNASIPPGVA